jgi:peptidoglycan/LPS O-acetylase OafA/YrhL
MPTIGYHKEIDGLRAIAVLVIIFFHMKIPGFSGGFIGVDVFSWFRVSLLLR